MNFDYDGYDAKFIQRKRCLDITAHNHTSIYKFYSPKTLYHYIIHVEDYDYDVYVIKFYVKKDKKSDRKYNKTVNKGDLGNIVLTCIKLVPIILDLNPNASFAFIASRSYDKKTKKVEDIINNQRFRIYSYLVGKKIGNETFEHFAYENISGYLLVNRLHNNIMEKEREIVQMFANTYNEIPDMSN